MHVITGGFIILGGAVILYMMILLCADEKRASDVILTEMYVTGRSHTADMTAKSAMIELEQLLLKYWFDGTGLDVCRKMIALPNRIYRP